MPGQSTETTQQNVTGFEQLSHAPGELPSIQRGPELISDFVRRFNEQTGQDVSALNADTLLQSLRSGGAVNDEIMSGLSSSDIMELTGLTKVVASALQAELSSLKATDKQKPRRRMTRFGAQALELEDLVSRYQPDDVGSAVNTELKKRVKEATGRDARIIVFDDEGSVISDVTTRLIREAMQGDPDLEQVEAGGKIRYTFRVGELPQQVVEVHPINGEVLRSNGIGQDGLDWSKIPQETRQLLHLAVKSGELTNRPSRRDLVYYYGAALSSSGFAQLQNEFPEAAREYADLEALGDLPSLKQYRRERSPGKGKKQSDRLFQA